MRKRIALGAVAAIFAALVPSMVASAASAAPAAPAAPAAGSVVPDSVRQAQVYGRMSAAERASKEAQIRMPPPNIVPKPVASGRHPYGGEKYSALSIDGTFVFGCSAGVATRSTDGRQFIYTAGHCVKDDNTGADDVSSTTGRFKYPYSTCWGTGCPPVNIGNTGHGGSHFDSFGDQSFIRANLAPSLYRELEVWDSRVTVNAFTAGNPVYLENASMSGGTSQKLVHGFVNNANTTATVAGRTIGNLAILQVDYQKEGCAEPGDSGGPIISSQHDVIGVTSLAANDGVTCWIWFGRAGVALTSVNQTLAPAAPGVS